MSCVPPKNNTVAMIADQPGFENDSGAEAPQADLRDSVLGARQVLREPADRLQHLFADRDVRGGACECGPWGEIGMNAAEFDIPDDHPPIAPPLRVTDRPDDAIRIVALDCQLERGTPAIGHDYVLVYECHPFPGGERQAAISCRAGTHRPGTVRAYGRRSSCGCNDGPPIRRVPGR